MENLTLEKLQELKQAEKTVYLFTTTWCGDCHYIKPFMPEIVEKFADFTFVEVDRDEFMPFAQEHSVMGIPSFITYNKGEEVSRWVNGDRKTQEEIEAYLKETREKI